MTGRASIVLVVLGLVTGCGEPMIEHLPDAGLPDRCGPSEIALIDGRCVADDEDDDDDGLRDGVDCAPRDATRQLALDDGRCVADDDDDDDDGALDDRDCAPRDPSRHIDCGADPDADGDGVPDRSDCAPADPSASLELVDGRCVADDADDDDDGALDDDDCAPLDPSAQVERADGRCVDDDEDDDDDGTIDETDCAPLDARFQVGLDDGGCVADDDDDGALDDHDCAPRDPAAQIALDSGGCAADDADDDDDGVSDDDDCAPRDATRSVTLATGACVSDDGDDDDDGVDDRSDCAALDPALQILLSGGECVADDSDDDDDGVNDPDDCAPRDASRQLRIASGACVADDSDDDDDGISDATDCAPVDERFASGPCSPSSTESEVCGTNVGACVRGTRTRTCLDNCHFGPWSACGGLHVGPITEACGTGVDDDCDGRANEGCGCAPTPPGMPGTFSAPGDLRKLRADPSRCLAYALEASLTSADPSAFVVFDTRTKREIARLVFGVGVQDYDLSPDGSRIAIARRDTQRIEIYAPPSWTPIASYDLGRDVSAIEIGDGPWAWYSVGTSIHRLRLSDGATATVASGITILELELMPDESALLVAESSSDSLVRRFVIETDGTLTLDGRTGPLAFGAFVRDFLTVSSDGSLAAFGGTLFDPEDLEFVLGSVAQHLDAFDASGRFLVGGAGVVDAALARAGSASWATDTAALVSADTEVWWHDASTGEMHYVNVADLVDPATLGSRERAPAALGDYDFTDLAADPTRPWVYALDPTRAEVVVFDRASLLPITAIEVGHAPTEMSIDPGGRHLLVGHYTTWGVARIDRDQLSFDGFLRTHLRPTELASPRAGRVLASHALLPPGYSPPLAQPVLMDVDSGVRLHRPAGAGYSAPAFALAGDGVTVHLVESGSSSSCLYSLDTTGDRIVRRAGPLACAERYGVPQLTALPTSADVYAGAVRHRMTDGSLVHSLPETILSVSPDGSLAISSASVFDTATMTRLRTLPSSTVHALSADGRTLYQWRASRLGAVDLTPLYP